jgi:uncharacterized protein (TIGR02391 family)
MFPEEKAKNEIFEKIEELNCKGSIVECALYRKNINDPKWYIFILKITLTKTEQTFSAVKPIAKEDFVLFRMPWSVDQVKELLSAIAYLRKIFTESQKYPDEKDIFVIGDYNVRICSNYGGQELQLISCADSVYCLQKMDRPYYLAQYHYQDNQDIKYTRSPNFIDEDPPFNNAAQAVNHHFNMSLDTYLSDYQNFWVGILLPTYGAKIRNYKVSGNNLKVEIQLDPDQTDLSIFDLSVICRSKDRMQFTKKLHAEENITLTLPFSPVSMEMTLLKRKVKIDFCCWSEQTNGPEGMFLNNSGTEQSRPGLEISEKNFGHLHHLHPEVYSKCHELYEGGAYPEAVEKSFKVVRDRLRTLTSYETGSEAFGKGKLHINGAAAPNVEKDFNEGVKFLTMAIDKFRNEKSHTSDAKIDDPARAYEYLCLSSLAMHFLDGAEIKP